MSTVIMSIDTRPTMRVRNAVDEHRRADRRVARIASA